MMRSIRELKKGRKHVVEEIKRNKIRLMNAINKGKYRDDNEKRKIINRIDEVQAELRFDVNTVDNLQGTHEFLVTLKSPTGMIYDSTWAIFDTQKYDSKSPDELYEQNKGSEVVLPADLVAPVITLNGTDPVTLTCGVDTYVEEGATAIDDVDGTVPVTIGGDTVDTSVNGTYIVTYTAKDSTCNTAQESRTVEVVGTCPTPLVGDNDFDGDVDLVDLGRLAENWLEGT